MIVLLACFRRLSSSIETEKPSQNLASTADDQTYSLTYNAAGQKTVTHTTWLWR